MVNEDYSKPFYVGVNNTRFPHRSMDGYLEALESRIDDTEPKEVVVVHRQSSMSKQEHDILEQLVKRVDWLQKKILEKEQKTQKKEMGYY